MKTKAMSQQVAGLDFLAGKYYGALFMEQGTGKSFTALADAERAYNAGKISLLLILAPNGVHANWILREVPTHLECARTAVVWRSGMGIGARRDIDHAMFSKPNPGLKIFSINYDALRSAESIAFVKRLMLKNKTMIVADESQKIKNLQAATTKAAIELRDLSIARRILSGTPMDKPEDIFAQMEFLKKGLLGPSYRSFVSEYAVLANWREPKSASDFAMKKMVEKHPRTAHAIVIAKNEDTGQPMYRNLDRLQKIIEPHAFRVLKKDCLDLPPKIYTSLYFDLSPKQRAAYDLMENEFRIKLENGEVTSTSALASLIKLQQITSGFVVVPGREEMLYIPDKNPRIEILAEHVRDQQCKMIVWARFREEIAALAATFKAMGKIAVEYHGDVKNTVKRGETHSERDLVIDRFQTGDAEVFLGIQKAGGAGLTLTAAQQAAYCSNEFSVILRLQSEDRNHRIGSVGEHITYTDMVGVNTIDESITKTHQFKMNLAQTVLGDRKLDVRRFSATIDSEN